MNGRPINIRKLADRLLAGDDQPFDASELDAVLNWLSGSERAGAGELIRHIGTPRERPDLTNRIFFQLDGQLFDCGRLILQRAFVDAGVDEGERRARFRRLMTAFHPDHHPSDTGWLTPRSQAIHEAWRRFRSGEDDAVKDLAKHPGARRPGKPAEKYRSPERRSARLVPISPALLARIRTHLQQVEHLQGKALLAIAVISFIPVAWVYFAHQPYRAQAPSQVQVQTPPEHGVVPATHPEPPVAEREPLSQPVQQAETPSTAGATAWEEVNARLVAAAFEAVESAEAPLPVVEPLAEGTLAAAEDVPAEPEPVAEVTQTATPQHTTADITEEASSAESRTPARVADAAEAVESSGQEPPSSRGEPEAVATAQSTEVPVEEAGDPRPAVAEADTAAADDTGDAGDSEPEPAEELPEPIKAEPVLAAVGLPEDPLDHAAMEEETGPMDPAEAEQRITQLLRSYRQTFERGQLDGLLGHFTDHPRENANEGRRWLRRNYQQLFDSSSSRQMTIEIENISHTGEAWQVDGRFDLHIDYHERRSVRASRVVRYTILEENEQFRIASIEY